MARPMGHHHRRYYPAPRREGTGLPGAARDSLRAAGADPDAGHPARHPILHKQHVDYDGYDPMRLARETSQVFSKPASAGERGTVLIIVLWVALGLVSIALFFADSMSFELRASDNRVCGVAADQAIEAGARYVSALLGTVATNGDVPDVTLYASEAVPVGEAHFWLIGRPGDYLAQNDEVFFGLVDEGSKLNLNNVSADQLAM